MKPWNMNANRALSQDSGRESILPSHSVSNENPETGIWKTVDVRVGAFGDEGSDAADKFVQRLRKVWDENGIGGRKLYSMTYLLVETQP